MLVMLLGLRLIVLSSTLPSQSGLTHPRDGTSAGSVRVGRAVRETLSTTHLRRGSRVGGAAASHQCVWGGRRRRPPADTTSRTLQTLLREGPLLRISACGAGGAGEPSNTSRKHYKPYFTNLAAGGAAASHQCVWGMRCGRARRHNQQTLQTLL